MSARAASRLAWSLLAVTMTALAAAFVASSVRAGLANDLVTGTIVILFVLAFALVGALVAARQPSNPLGWIMCVAGLAFALGGFADEYAQAYVENPNGGPPGATFALWLTNWVWAVGIGPTATFLLLLFPTGRLPSPHWRPVAWLAAASLTLMVPGLAFRAGQYDGYPAENPVGIEGASLAGGLGLAALMLATLLSVASLLSRYRSAGRQERQQLKWLLFAAAVVALMILSFLALEWAGVQLSDDLVNGLVTASVTTLPVAIGVAILRHRLYDIDVVVNRTLVYGALTVALAAAYLGSVLLLQLILSPGSDLAIAASTLAVAALFRPARSRIQALVDRRFYRRKYDAAQALDGFAARLRDEVALDSLSRELRGVVVDTVQPAHVSLWLRTDP